jgi:hypothetical protein
MKLEETWIYKTDTDINVTEVYNKLMTILSKQSVLQSKRGREVKSRIEEIYKIFKVDNLIKEDLNRHELDRLSMIKRYDIQWFIWFALQLLTLPRPKVIIHLEHHLSKSPDKEKFKRLINGHTMNLLCQIELNYFEPIINEIKIWVISKNYYSNELDESIDIRIIPYKSEPEVRAYFNQLLLEDRLTEDQVNNLVNSNFKYGEPGNITKLDIDIEKANLNYFIHFFFKNYTLNSKNSALKTSAFLRANFRMYDAESADPEKEKNLRKNLRLRIPATYPFLIKK